MKTHKHHKIARSRGGTDDEWNLVELDPYTHAYEHALDFVLFDGAPVFDCRHEAWPLLPTDLQDAVRQRLREIWNSRQSEKGLRGGVSAREKQVGVCSPGFGSVVSSNMQNLVSTGAHWFQTKEHSVRVSRLNQDKFANGTHPLQQPGECPVCGLVLKTKGGLGPHMKKHKNEKQ